MHRERAARRIALAGLAPLALAALCASLSGRQLPPDQVRSDVSPSRARASLGVRNAHAMALDARNRRVLLFGGATDTDVRGDTWTWNGNEWMLAATDGPSPRTFPAIAHDAARGEIVLFGGNSVLFGAPDATGTFLADTWTWNGTRWRRMAPAGAVPAARAEAAMAYDVARKRTVMFGGHATTSGGRQRFGDTWEWDGARWTLLATAGPAPRNGAPMTFHPRLGRVVLFGGNGPSGETWTWNGQTWTMVPHDPIAGRFNPVLSLDPATRDVLRFGGWTGRSRDGETWRFDGQTWRKLTAIGPAPRNHAAAAFDPFRRRVVLFGGHDGEFVFGDTWEWDGRAWALRQAASARKRVMNEH